MPGENIPDLVAACLLMAVGTFLILTLALA
jgi:hypothetical protein